MREAVVYPMPSQRARGLTNVIGSLFGVLSRRSLSLSVGPVVSVGLRSHGNATDGPGCLEGRGEIRISCDESRRRFRFSRRAPRRPVSSRRDELLRRSACFPPCL